MRVRYWIGLGLILLIVLATGSMLLTGSTFDAQSSPSYLHVTRVNHTGASNQTVAFADLDSDQQRIFKMALESEESVPRIPAEVDEHVWIDNRYVTYQNRTYRVAVSVP